MDFMIKFQVIVKQSLKTANSNEIELQSIETDFKQKKTTFLSIRIQRVHSTESICQFQFHFQLQLPITYA